MQNIKIFGFLGQCKQFQNPRFSAQPTTGQMMHIAYYMPFKPMGHAHPSGDLVTGTEIYDHLAERGHTISLTSRLRCRWIYYKPRALIRLLWERRRILRHYDGNCPDLWLSYHSYYKAPDLLGAACAKKLGIPYVIFQGIYSTKRRRRLKTLPGFLLNKKVLQSTDHIFTNKKRDLSNLRRLLPDDRLSYIAPGIHPEFFSFSPKWRESLRKLWDIREETVVMSAAMMRPGVKSDGLIEIFRACGELVRRGLSLKLVVAGDGSNRKQIEETARKLLPGCALFLGKIPRLELFKYYSGADIFAFPGIEESLGMVYLEAQSCGLPVVAYGDWGAGEAVIHEQTGLLSSATAPAQLTNHLQLLIEQPEKRHQLGENGTRHIRDNHDLLNNYSRLEKKLLGLVAKK